MPGGGAEQDKRPDSNVPAGAKLCDRAIFGKEVYDGLHGATELSYTSTTTHRRSYTKQLAVQRVEDYRRLEASRELQPPLRAATARPGPAG